MFRFENIENLYYLFSIPIVLFLLYWSIRVFKTKINKIGDEALVRNMINGHSILMTRILNMILPIAILLICLSWANPQWGYKTEKVNVKNSEIFIAMDISLSMLAEDISPSRLERAKRFCQNLLKEFRGEKVGLILFAGNAYLQVPITHDLAAVEIFVRSANIGLAGTQGTNIAQALQFAHESFSQNSDSKKTIIVVTDGENHEEDALIKAKELADTGVSVHCIGVGTSEGGFIPITENRRKGYKKDESGSPIKTSLNIDLVKDLANAGGGKSFLLANSKEVLKELKDEVEKSGTRTTEQQSFTDYKSYYQGFLLFGVLILLLRYLMTNGILTITKKK